MRDKAASIEVWLDDATDYESPVYCISLCAADGEELLCLGHTPRQDEAVALAKKVAASQRIPVKVR